MIQVEDVFKLANAKIAIVGLGLMGGSLALALRGKCAAIYGVDPDESNISLALNQKIVDFANTNPAKILPFADVVILAAPVPAILTILDDLSDIDPNPCVVFDLGSTKADIANRMASLPGRFDPIGGHPICGKERLTLANADRTLYFAAPFLFTPLPRTSPRAFSVINQVVTAIGAKAEFLSAEEHDRILASTSHLPFLLSSALVLATPANVGPYIGPGFRSSSRLAGTPESMMLGVIMTNRPNILSALEKLQDELSMFISEIAEGDIESLRESLHASQEAFFQLSR